MKNKSKHIVLLTPGFPKSEEDSTTIPALQIYVKALKESNPKFDVKVITFQFPFTLTQYNWFGISVFPLNGRNKKYNKLLVWKKALQLLNKIHQKKSIDLIHSFWLGECALIGSKFTTKNNIKHLVTAMGQDVSANLYLNLILKNKLNNTQIITLSKTHKKLLLKNYTLNSTIISWGINPKNFPKTQDKNIDIIGVGSLIKVKNFSLFIKIISKLKKQTKNLNVEIIGDGDFKHQLIQEVKHHKLQDVIIFKGKLSRQEVLEKMAKSKILLHTSSYESFGLVFLEALQSNMKVVSFDVGFANKSKNWFVCKNNTEIIKSLKEILSNFQINKSTAIYTIENTVLNYLKIYNE